MRLGIGNPLREGSLRTTASAASNRARQILVVFEVAISLVLLIGAALLVETFKKLSSVEPGFNPHNVVTMQASLTDDRFTKTEAMASFCNRLVTRLEAWPGVLAVGITYALPLEPGRDLPFEIIGHPTSGENMPEEQIRGISPHYFSAMSIPVIAGGHSRSGTRGKVRAAWRNRQWFNCSTALYYDAAGDFCTACCCPWRDGPLRRDLVLGGAADRELGVRSALGSGRGDLFKLVVGQGVRLAAIGLLMGVAASLGLTRFLRSILYGVRPSDPFVVATVTVVLVAVALFACYVPAHRAARVDPVIALREE